MLYLLLLIFSSLKTVAQLEMIYKTDHSQEWFKCSILQNKIAVKMNPKLKPQGEFLIAKKKEKQLFFFLDFKHYRH